MTPELGSHVALTTPDDRARFNLKRYIHPAARDAAWRVYVGDDGKTITLEAVES